MPKPLGQKSGALMAARAAGYRSVLEQKLHAELKRRIPDTHIPYEEHHVAYEVPARQTFYVVDFYIPTSGILLEPKGYLDAKCRQKYLLIRKQNPGIEIVFVFMNPNERCKDDKGKSLKTTYAQWCDKHGFRWCGVPLKNWVIEPDEHTPARIAAFNKGMSKGLLIMTEADE